MGLLGPVDAAAVDRRSAGSGNGGVGGGAAGGTAADGGAAGVVAPVVEAGGAAVQSMGVARRRLRTRVRRVTRQTVTGMGARRVTARTGARRVTGTGRGWTCAGCGRFFSGERWRGATWPRRRLAEVTAGVPQRWRWRCEVAQASPPQGDPVIMADSSRGAARRWRRRLASTPAAVGGAVSVLGRACSRRNGDGAATVAAVEAFPTGWRERGGERAEPAQSAPSHGSRRWRRRRGGLARVSRAVARSPVSGEYIYPSFASTHQHLSPKPLCWHGSR